MTRRIAVCGGTSLGHAVAAVVAADPQNEVTIWTRQPHRWASRIRAIYLDIAEVAGPLAVVSDDPSEVIKGAEIVFVCLPLPVRRAAIERMAAHLAPFAWVGGIPGFAGFDWEARAVLGGDARVFGLQRVPYVRKTISYGEAVWISGIRPRLFVAALPAREAPRLAERIEQLLSIPTTPLSSYLPVNLSASNAIFHPARLLGAFGRPDLDERHPRRAQFYEDWDDAASRAYIGLDEDIQRLVRALDVDPSEAAPIMDHFTVGTVGELTDRIRSIRALRDRLLPLTGIDGDYRLDRTSPYITEDACFALPVLRSIADVVAVETPWMDRAVRWAEAATGQSFLHNGSIGGPDAEGLPTPRAYGLCDSLTLMNAAC